MLSSKTASEQDSVGTKATQPGTCSQYSALCPPQAHPQATQPLNPTSSLLLHVLGLTLENRTLCWVSMLGCGWGVRVGSWVLPLLCRVLMGTTRHPGLGNLRQELWAPLPRAGGQPGLCGGCASEDHPAQKQPAHHRARQGAHPHPGECRQPGAGWEKAPPSVLLLVCPLWFLSLGPSCSSTDGTSE